MYVRIILKTQSRFGLSICKKWQNKMLDFGNIFVKLDIENGEIECFQKYINYIQE